jgi:uncharacterized membrane protein required for colicin V production
MYLDIAVVLIIFISAFVGWHVGFMRGLLGFFSNILSAVVAISCANPVAGVLDAWFGVSKYLGRLVSGQGKFITVLICAIVIYAFVRLLFFLLSRLALLIKKKDKKFDTADKIGGVFLGVVKSVFSMCLFCVTFYLLTAVPFMGAAVDWFFKGSTVGSFIYDITVEIIMPIFGSVQAAIFGGSG